MQFHPGPPIFAEREPLTSGVRVAFCRGESGKRSISEMVPPDRTQVCELKKVTNGSKPGIPIASFNPGTKNAHARDCTAQHRVDSVL